MKNKFIKICFLTILLMLIIPIMTVSAADKLLPKAYDNLNINLIKHSYLVATDNGYMRVFYDENKINIEYYDNNFNITSKKTVAKELEIFGGFFAGKDAYYLVEGQNNTNEDNNAEVIRVIKYDKNWKKLGNAKITSNLKMFIGGEVRFPFDYGCVEMTENNGYLYIVTGHEGYVDEEIGQGHQGLLMIKVDEKAMTGEIVDSNLWHSFAQYIDYKNSNFYLLELDEGSRYTKLTKYDEKTLNSKSIPLLRYGGDRTSTWAVKTYSSVDGMAISSNNILTVGTSIDQEKYDSLTSSTSHNIYLSVTPINNFTESASKVIWLTKFQNDGKSFLGVKITKVNDNRFMISWEEYDSTKEASVDDTLSGSTLHYIFVDGNGKQIGEEFKAAAPISECNPIVKDGKIVYYAASDNMVNFYTIDGSTGKFSKKTYRVAGENVSWTLKDGTLTFSGTNKIVIDSSPKPRFPLSSANSMFSYSSSDNAWKPIRDKIKKIVIGDGITAIPDEAFSSFGNLTEVTVGNSVTSIGKKAFYRCSNLEKISIPASVKSIGEDFLWTGSYYISDDSHVVRAVIYAPTNSYALDYAKKNNIRYVEEIVLSQVKNLNTSSQTTNSITLSWSKVTGATDYNVYKYNTSTKSYDKVASVSSNSYTVKSLSANTTYKFEVRAYRKQDDKYYYGEYSSEYETTTSPKAVTSLSATKETNNSITLSWNKVSGNNVRYVVFKYNTSTKGYEKIATVSNASSYTFKNLNAGTTYKFKVRTVIVLNNTYYYGDFSKEFSATTNPSKVSNLKNKTQTTNSITLSWSKVTGATGYNVYKYNTSTKKYDKVASVSGNSYTVKSLSANTTYKFKVRAYRKQDDKYYYGEYSSEYETTTSPKAVTSLSATKETNNSITLSWNKVSGNNVRYVVFKYNTSKKSYEKIATVSNASSYTFKNLKANTTYKFKVRSVTVLNNTYYYGDFSKEIKGTTKK